MKKIFDIWYYLEGTYRYHLWYSDYRWLIRKHIREQIAWRITIMRPICYQQGSCEECGCKTTALQMCGKMCDGLCYPPLYTRRVWKRLGDILQRVQIKKPELFKNIMKNEMEITRY